MRCITGTFIIFFVTTVHGLISNSPKPIPHDAWPDRFPAKDHCSRCGLCETSYVSEVTNSCAFLGKGMSGIDEMELAVHGRKTYDDLGDVPRLGEQIIDETRYGVHFDDQPIKLAKGSIDGSQWSGVVSSIAISMLEEGLVDAVVCIASKDEDIGESGNVSWSEPVPIVAKTVEDVLRGRGVKPALAPSLAVLDEIKNDEEIERLLFCGVGCAVQAFRSIQSKLGLKKVYVLGTNCVDNSPTSTAARSFIKDGVGVDPAITLGYEFMQDFRVHVKTGGEADIQYEKLPYFCLPGTIAKQSIAKSCLTCYDYTNRLADVVVGYMASPLEGDMDKSLQTITIRNARGKEMVQTALDNRRIQIFGDAKGKGAHEEFTKSTLLSDSIILELIGDEVPSKGMPKLVGEIFAFVIEKLSPKGLNFGKYSIDYHLLRNYLYSVHTWGQEKADVMLPRYARNIVQQYCEKDETILELIRKLDSKKK